jgi:Mn-dependent DtxR family transcriptional regulator
LRIKTIEDYIELIYKLQKEEKRVHTNDVASTFNINPASVTEIFQKLTEEGFIDYEKYKGVVLTKKGEDFAKKTLFRHNQLKEFLIILGVDQKIAEIDACEMEHILHKTTMEAIIKFVENKKN